MTSHQVKCLERLTPAHQSTKVIQLAKVEFFHIVELKMSTESLVALGQKGKQQIVQSVDRAFSLLSFIAKSSKGVTLTELSNLTGLAKTTTLRLLNTLEHLEVVERSTSHRYRLGETLANLYAARPFNDQLVTLAEPYMKTLNEQTGETVNICVADGREALYLDQLDSRHHIQLQDWIGFRTPMHVVSGGKGLLAYSPKEKINRYLSQPLAKFTDKSVTDPKRLEDDLLVVRSRGYSVTQDEFELEMIAVAAPVKDSMDRVIAALCLGGPRYRLNLKDRRLKAQLVKQVTQQANLLSQRLASVSDATLGG